MDKKFFLGLAGLLLLNVSIYAEETNILSQEVKDKLLALVEEVNSDPSEDVQIMCRQFVETSLWIASLAAKMELLGELDFGIRLRQNHYSVKRVEALCDIFKNLNHGRYVPDINGRYLFSDYGEEIEHWKYRGACFEFILDHLRDSNEFLGNKLMYEIQEAENRSKDGLLTLTWNQKAALRAWVNLVNLEPSLDIQCMYRELVKMQHEAIVLGIKIKQISVYNHFVCLAQDDQLVQALKGGYPTQLEERRTARLKYFEEIYADHKGLGSFKEMFYMFEELGLSCSFLDLEELSLECLETSRESYQFILDHLK